MIKIKIKTEELPKCPPATQNIKLNLKNRQHAIEEYGYGPPNPQEPNEEFWAKKAEMWNTDPETAKTMRCGNCAAFNISDEMKDCIRFGLKKDGTSQADDFEAVIDKAKLGYCEMYKFKCAASRTCDAWVTKEEESEKEK